MSVRRDVMRLRLRRAGIGLLAPVSAIVLAITISSIVLEVSGYSARTAFESMWDYGKQGKSIVSVLNRAIPLYIGGLAVAVGFKMNLFNIGVEGQYRLAALLAASAGAAVSLPAPLHVGFIILIAMIVGSAWAGIAGVLKVTRNVHEVIATIMLNYISYGLGAWLLENHLRERTAASDLIIKTPEIPESGRIGFLNSWLESFGIDFPPNAYLQGFLVAAILCGIVYFVLVWRTRFGYDLRASGENDAAAKASGVDPKKMVIRTMLISGGIAGLIGVTQIVGDVPYRYSVNFQTGLGFTAIGVALLGRNHPVGIAAGALLFAYLERSAQVLDLEGIPKEIAVIMQGIILLSVVIAYAVVKRIVEAQEARALGRASRHLEETEAVPA